MERASGAVSSTYASCMAEPSIHCGGVAADVQAQDCTSISTPSDDSGVTLIPL